MRISIKMIDAENAKVTKSFDKISDVYSDAEGSTYLKNLANAYAAMTTSVTTTATKVVTSDLPLTS